MTISSVGWQKTRECDSALYAPIMPQVISVYELYPGEWVCSYLPERRFRSEEEAQKAVNQEIRAELERYLRYIQ